MPKDYQISQYDMPLTQGGVVRYWLEDGTVKECRLTRIHLEEDTGKSTHAGSDDGRIAGSTYSLVDFNRAGVPLMECVSEPELHSADEAVGYLEALRRTLQQLGVSDVKMEEGSLRCDANVSVRPVGSEKLGTKTEIKNMNSFRSVHRAIETEIERQIDLLEKGERIIQETRGWDELRGITVPMRSKEEAHDYRYFPDPDLVPLEIARGTVERLREQLPELPVHRFERYTGKLGLDAKQATQLVDNARARDIFRFRSRGQRESQTSDEFRSRRSLAIGQRDRQTGVRIGGDSRASRRADCAGRRQDDQLQDCQRPGDADVERRGFAQGNRATRRPRADQRSGGRSKSSSTRSSRRTRKA